MSHQDFLQRQRLAHILCDPGALPSVLGANDYVQIKAFVLETTVGGASALLRRIDSGASPQSVADPAKFDLRGLPTSLDSLCQPPAYPMCNSDNLASRANRTPPRGYAQTPGAGVLKPPLFRVEARTAAQRCLLPCGTFDHFVARTTHPSCFKCSGVVH